MYADTAHGANPVDASLMRARRRAASALARLRSCRLSSSIPASAMNNLPFVKLAHDIGQVVMGFAFKDVADGKRRVLGDGRSVGGGKLGTNHHEHSRPPEDDTPGQEGVVPLAGYRMATGHDQDGLSCSWGPPRNGAARNFEQINAFYSRCDHQHPSCKSGIWSVPTVSQSETKNSIYNAQEKYTRWGAVFPGNAHTRGNPKILAKIGNSVVEPLLKTVQTAEEREIDKRNA